MRVLVAGGTGVLGREVVTALLRAGNEPVVLTRGAAGTREDQVERRSADLATGRGLAEAVVGVEAVVDAANSAGRGAGDVLVRGTAALLAAAAGAGVRHHVAVSIVGVDRVPIAYYRAKVAQERVVAEGPVPWSLLRATQFHDLVDQVLSAAGRYRLLPLVSGVPLQPVAPAEVARALVAAVEAGPGGVLPEVGGPQVQPAAGLARSWAAARGSRGLPLPVRMPGAAGRALRAGALTTPGRAVGVVTFEDWLAARPRRGTG